MTAKLQFPQVVLVDASAGSGKTFALAQRYLRLLMQREVDVSLDSILAITFTNKAAYEMKARIVDFLKKIALDAFDKAAEKQALLGVLGVPEEEARMRAFRIMDAIIRNYNFFQVQTIDSFINAILSGCAFKLGLSAHFKTEKEYQEFLRYSLDRLIDRAGREEETLELFRRFLRNYLHIERQTGWFPKRTIYAVVQDLFSKSNNCAGELIRTPVDPGVILERKKEIILLIGRLNDNLPDGTHASFRKSVETFVIRHRNAFDINDLSDFFARDEFPINKGKQLPQGTRQLWNEIKAAVRDSCELEAACALNDYVDIFNGVAGELKKIAGRQDVLFLEALNKEARRLFSEHCVGLPELYYRLATRFRHFLIDEFQDTSRLQWANLYLMIEDALASGGSLFYVGDKKQAIYRFRGGDVSLIDAVRGYFGDFNFQVESLSMNYRSTRSIVGFNNEVFSISNLRGFFARWEECRKGFELEPAGQDEIISVFEHARQEHKPGAGEGYVRVSSADGDVREDVLALVEDARKRFGLGEIALLARTNDEVELLTSWLLEAKVPVESEKTLNIRQHPLIKELVSFLRFLHSPIDDLAFASFIMGDIFCNASGIGQQAVRDFIFSLRPRKEPRAYLYREFRRQFEGAWEAYIEKFFKSVGFVPLYELAVSVYSAYGVLDAFSDYQGFFMRFLELIKEKEEKYPGIGAFLDYFDNAPSDDLYVNAADSDAVKVLTIHKAKGLEFPLVIVPFLEMNVKVRDSVVASAQEDGVGLMRLRKRAAVFSPLLHEVYQREYRAAFIDELNSMYVVLTRAQEELYVFVSSRAESGFNPAGILLPRNDFESGRRRDDRRPVVLHTAPTRHMPVSRYADWIHMLRDEFEGESVLPLRESVNRGELLHAILSGIGNVQGADSGAVVTAAVQRAAAAFPAMAGHIRECDAIVRQLVAREDLSRYFAVSGGVVFTEKDIVEAGGALRRVDRLVVTEGDAVVIDYKSSRDNSAQHHRQVAGYMAVIRDIYPGRAVKGLLVYLDDMQTEDVDGADHNI